MAFGSRRGAVEPRGRRTVAEEDAAVAEERPPRGRVAAARGAGAVGSVMLLVARIVRLVVGVIVLLIVAGILLRVLGANMSNSVVKDINDAAKFFVGPFDGIFSLSNAKVAIAVNWGIGALVYLIVGGFIASLIARAAPSGVAPRETVR